MDCKQAAALLHEFLDQELRQSDPAGESALAAHLESCAACRQMVDAHAELRAAVRQHAGYRATPPALLETIREGLEHSTTGGPQEEQAAMHALPLHRPRWQWWSRWGSFGSIMSTVAATAAVTASVTWIAAMQFNDASQQAQAVEQVIAGHARSVLTGHLTDIVSSDQHNVKPWLSSKLDFSPPVANLANAGFELQGGRLDYLERRPVAALVYRHRLHIITVYVWPEVAAQGNAGSVTVAVTSTALSRQGYNILHWSDAGMSLWAISDVNAQDLKSFADNFSAARS